MTSARQDKRPDQPFTTPTRRAFVALLGATAAALVLRERAPVVYRDPTGRPIWIGH